MGASYRLHDGSIDEYQSVVDIGLSVRSDDPMSVGDLVDRDRRHAAGGRLHGRWLAEIDGRVVGFGEYGQLPWLDPDVMYADVMVHPRHQATGIGRGLLERVEGSAGEGGASRLFGHVDERHPEVIRILEAHGWVEIDRWWESSLDLAEFDPSSWSAVVDRVMDQGVVLTSLASLRDRREGWKEELHRMYTTLEQDVPTAQEIRTTPFEAFVERTLGRRMLPEGFLVAFLDDEMIGLTELISSEVMRGVVHQDLTGVLEGQRGRGIATALKVVSATWAKEQGYRSIRTMNAQSNAPMLAVNLKLGFERGAASIELMKRI